MRVHVPPGVLQGIGAEGLGQNQKLLLGSKLRANGESQIKRNSANLGTGKRAGFEPNMMEETNLQTHSFIFSESRLCM